MWAANSAAEVTIPAAKVGVSSVRRRDETAHDVDAQGRGGGGEGRGGEGRGGEERGGEGKGGEGKGVEGEVKATGSSSRERQRIADFGIG
jgi:hypothetical protein